MFSCGKLVSINIQLVARGPSGDAPQHPIDSDDALIKRLDGAGDFVFAVGGQPLVAEHAQLDQVVALL